MRGKTRKGIRKRRAKIFLLRLLDTRYILLKKDIPLVCNIEKSRVLIIFTATSGCWNSICIWDIQTNFALSSRHWQLTISWVRQIWRCFGLFLLIHPPNYSTVSNYLFIWLFLLFGNISCPRSFLRQWIMGRGWNIDQQIKTFLFSFFKTKATSNCFQISHIDKELIL